VHRHPEHHPFSTPWKIDVVFGEHPIFLMAFGLPVGWHILRHRFQALGYWSQNSPSFDDSDLERGEKGFVETGRAGVSETAFWKTKHQCGK